MQNRTRVRGRKALLLKIGNICDIDHVSSLPYTFIQPMLNDINGVPAATLSCGP